MNNQDNEVIQFEQDNYEEEEQQQQQQENKNSQIRKSVSENRQKNLFQVQEVQEYDNTPNNQNQKNNQKNNNDNLTFNDGDLVNQEQNDNDEIKNRKQSEPYIRRKVNSITTLQLNNKQQFQIGQYYYNQFNPREESEKIQSNQLIQQKQSQFAINSQQQLQENQINDEVSDASRIPSSANDRIIKQSNLLNQVDKINENIDDEVVENEKNHVKQVQQQSQQSSSLISQAELIAKLSKSERKKFIQNPIPKDQVFEMYIVREKQRFNLFAPKYHLYLQNSNMHILSSRKELFSISPSYIISLDKEDFNKKSSNYIGRMKSDMIDSTYQIFDAGDRPGNNQIKENLRCELALVHFMVDQYVNQNKMQVGIPKLINDQLAEKIQLEKNRSFFFNLFQQEDIRDNLLIFNNKSPVFDSYKQKYTLSLSTNALPSQKNFQLVWEDEQNQVLMEMLKSQAEQFKVKVQHPFSIQQAFGICLAVFDNYTSN